MHVLLFTYGSTSQGVKDWLFLGKYRFKSIKLKETQNQIGRFQIILKETLKKLGMLEYFKFSKY